jgi:hypothetical protein
MQCCGVGERNTEWNVVERLNIDPSESRHFVVRQLSIRWLELRQKTSYPVARYLCATDRSWRWKRAPVQDVRFSPKEFWRDLWKFFWRKENWRAKQGKDERNMFWQCQCVYIHVRGRLWFDELLEWVHPDVQVNFHAWRIEERGETIHKWEKWDKRVRVREGPGEGIKTWMRYIVFVIWL